MPVDILIFAVIAAILIYRLNNALGTRNEGDLPSRPNPFEETPAHVEPARVVEAVARVVPDAQDFADYIDPAANKDGAVAAGLAEIAAADESFDAAEFMDGAKYAFNLIVTAYASGDRATLKPLLSPKLYEDFLRGMGDVTPDMVAPSPARVVDARIFEAHLGGAMAYVTVAFTTASGVKDIWTFTRDTRADDPNWILIETRTAEAA